ncbi:large subunit GTPase 1 homolog [Neolamprologus brichardi]|uniref:large subunit GTPase 1 homolog n=1 Tax=Neolamprologus brichardi TaxID=32507 RepID=UPI001643CD50|nr:large subunit GTPase 1 homolog [Neolamprologus brichardi]
MGKKKAGGGAVLGRALIKERLQAGRGNKRGDSWLHTSELNDGYDWGRLNLQSVTEQSSMDDFLATAELAGTEFVAEKLNIKFVPAEARAGLLTAEEKSELMKLHEDNKHFLRIPRRPHWDESTSPDELQQTEKDSFLEWRRALAQLEEEQKLILTPFERNLEFWRQLWRVIERSDVVVQIVDARNPLLFRCLDLESYVKEVSEHKVNMLLVNKADLLTREQRRVWAKYFEKEGLRAVFWSALAEGNRLDAEEKGMEVADPECEESDPEEGGRQIKEDVSQKGADGEEEVKNKEDEDNGGEQSDIEEEQEEVSVDEEDWKTCSEGEEEAEGETAGSSDASFHNSSRLLRKDELLEMFKTVHNGSRVKEGQLTVGLSTKAEMICSGILPIDQMRDHVPAISLICQTIPRHVLEGTYGINIIRPREDEDPDRPPTAEELLMAYGYMRGFMTSHGQPDQSRSARYVLKDYVSGKLLHCHPPPHIKPEDFQPQHKKFEKTDSDSSDLSTVMNRQHKIKRIENVVDKNFFHQENVRALSKGIQSVMGYKAGSGPVGPGKAESEMAVGKPWKKHGNRNKKEKVRRITKHLDA